ncbi:MAG TPA: enoyl-CoA hydratase/isomerase family protein [Gaiellaceae bacterium]|nr:enoyl-CoA hydratase/isomerase family protein [Gaiellaceae bacterium]
MPALEQRRAGAVQVLTLNRPERLNAIDRDLLGLLADAVADAARDDAVGCVVVTGAGERAFSAGADVTGFPALDPLGAQELMRDGQRVFASLEACPKPVIAAVNGYALGGGLELALACDLRVATATAKLGQPEIALANLPGWGGTQRLPRIVGEAIAKDLIFTGRLVDADEALAVHLVNRLTDGSALDAALTLAHELAEKAPAALAGAKAAIHAARSTGEHGYAVESRAVALCFTTPEQQEAVRGFLAGGRTTEENERRST